MLAYTSAEKALIRSNAHIGANRPLAEVTITGQPSGERLPLISVSVQPIKNGAGLATVVIDNKAGYYAPDSTGDWANIIWPNAEMTVKLGYGSNLETVFTGLIDSVEMRTFPQTLTIVARDYMKWALDQTVTDDEGYRSIDYNGTVNGIFTDLAERAGWAAADIDCDAQTDIIMISFVHETYADAMQKLCELYNFEYYADRDGKIHFHYATDRQPEAADESVALHDTTAEELAEYPIVTASIRVYSGTLETGTEYTKDTDYTIVEGDKDSPWTIARIAGGGIADGATVYVSYVYAAWVFEQGKDIVTLGYKLDDSGIYRTITVLGKTSANAVCDGDATYGSADYYNLLNQKVLILNDETSATSAACAVVAARTAVNCGAKVRRVDFQAVGNPYLDVGDCIMVIEQSSTISEIYRIAATNHQFTASGNSIITTTLAAYYYGYAPAE